MMRIQFKRLIYFILLQTACVYGLAQERDSLFIKQLVLDSFTKRGIPDVYITLADTNGVLIDTMWTTRYYATNNGYIWQKKVARRPQAFLLKAENPDYETVVMQLELRSPARLSGFSFPDLLMKRRIKEIALDEVTVSATRVQIAYKGDTIVVNAQAFKIPEGSMLDALVASVPGAELRDDGTIYMNGRKVDYLTLNGKDFFKGRNRMMLDNLPYYVVNKLKFYEKEMPHSQMIHKDTGEKDYVMDVEMKQEYSIGYTVNAEAGRGTNDKWMARLFGLRFSDNSRLVLFAGANNTNEVRPPGADGWHDRSKILTGEKEIKLVGGSFNVDDKNGCYNENAEATVSWTDNRDEMRTSREIFLSNGSVYDRNQDVSRNKDFGASLSNKLELKRLGLAFNTVGNYDKQEGDGLARSASFSSDPSVYGSCMQVLDSLFAPSVTAGLLEMETNKVLDQTKYISTSYNIRQDMAWDKVLPWGDNLSVKLDANYNRYKRNGFSRYDLTYKDHAQAEDKQDRFIPYRHHDYSYSAEGFYRWNLYSGWFVDCIYNYEQRYNHTENPLFRLDGLDYNLDFGVLPSQAEYLHTIDAGNSYQSHYMTKTHRSFLSIKRVINKENSLILFGIGSYLLHKNESEQYRRAAHWYNLQQRNWFAEPNMYFEYRCGNFRFAARYDSQLSTPNLVQMLDIEDTSNPLAITKGNPDLESSRRHHVYLKTSKGRFGASCGIELDVNILDNLVANGFTYNHDSGVYTYRPENVHGNWNTTATLNWNRSLDQDKRLVLRGKSSYNYIRNVDLTRVEGFTTSQVSRVNHHITSQNVIFSYNKGSLRMELIGDFAWNVATRELNDINNISAFDFSYGLSGQYTFPWKIQLASDLKMFSRRGYEEPSMNTNELVWNASLSRPFMKGKLIVKVDAFDILNQLSSTRYIVNGQCRTEIWQLCVPRYAMLKIAYRLNKNPKKK